MRVMATHANFATASRRPRPGTLTLILLLHVAAIYALAKFLAPQASASVERAVLSTFSVARTYQSRAPARCQQGRRSFFGFLCC